MSKSGCEMTLFVNILTKYNGEKKKQIQNPFDEKAAELTRIESICREKKGIREFGSIQWLHHNNKNTSFIRLNLVTHDSSQLSCFECTVHGFSTSNYMQDNGGAHVENATKWTQRDRKGYQIFEFNEEKNFELGQMIKPKYKLNFQLMRHIIL